MRRSLGATETLGPAGRNVGPVGSIWWSPRALGPARHRWPSWSRPASPCATGRSTGPWPGNTLSWAYVFEWPFFAAYAIYMWWRLVHEPARSAAAAAPAPPAGRAAPTPDRRRRPPGRVEDEVEDEELAAYNRYLAALNEADRQERR